MKLPPLIGVPLKFETLAVWAMHLGPETAAEWSGDAALNATRAAKHPYRMVPTSVFNISLPLDEPVAHRQYKVWTENATRLSFHSADGYRVFPRKAIIVPVNHRCGRSGNSGESGK